MAAANGSLGRSSAEQQDTAAAAAEPLWTLELRLEILELQRIINYISPTTSIQSKRVGFNEKKRHSFLKLTEKIGDWWEKLAC